MILSHDTLSFLYTIYIYRNQKILTYKVLKIYSWFYLFNYTKTPYISFKTWPTTYLSVFYANH